jgi:hypothetical protein
MHLPAASKALASQIFERGSSRMKTGDKGRQRTLKANAEPGKKLALVSPARAYAAKGEGTNGYGDGMSGQCNRITIGLLK